MGVRLERVRLDEIVQALADGLDGDWLLVGGAAIALWLEPRRVTEDLDLVPLRPTGGERLALMELAESLGLPVEAVNSAADFFVRRVDGWDREVIVLREGRRGTVYRPTGTLMVLLKLRRLSEQDLLDIQTVLASDEPVDAGRALAALTALPPTDDADLAARRAALADALRRDLDDA